MKSWFFGAPRLAAAFLFLVPGGLFAQDSASANGQSLAASLRAAAPDENSEVRGVLRIHSSSLRTNIPVVCKVEVVSNSWRTVYQTPVDTLSVVHFTNAPSQYIYSQRNGPTNSLAPSNAAIPLAGSDFSLADLGLEFLHWPVQRQLKGQMRLGQPCFVLESSTPDAAAGVVRVCSFIDKESGGIILADAYDAGGSVIKEFSLHGSFFRKVHGQWRLEKMEMIDKQKHSQTIFQFDIKE